MIARQECGGECRAMRLPGASSKSSAPETAPKSSPRAWLLRGSPALSSVLASALAGNTPHEVCAPRSLPARETEDRVPPDGVPIPAAIAHASMPTLRLSPWALARRKDCARFQVDLDTPPARSGVRRKESSSAVWQCQSERQVPPALLPAKPTSRASAQF